jgi:hypothetical protein
LSADEQGRGAMPLRVHAPGCLAYEIGEMSAALVSVGDRYARRRRSVLAD